MGLLNLFLEETLVHEYFSFFEGDPVMSGCDVLKCAFFNSSNSSESMDGVGGGKAVYTVQNNILQCYPGRSHIGRCSNENKLFLPTLSLTEPHQLCFQCHAERRLDPGACAIHHAN